MRLSDLRRARGALVPLALAATLVGCEGGGVANGGGGFVFDSDTSVGTSNSGNGFEGDANGAKPAASDAFASNTPICEPGLDLPNGVPPSIPMGPAQGPTPRTGNVSWLPWTAGHPIAVHGEQVLALDIDNGTLVRIDRATMKVVATVAVGKRPRSMVVAENGTAYIALQDDGAVARVDAGGKLLAPWQVGGEPMSVALTPNGAHLLVAIAGSRELRWLDVGTGTTVATAATGPHPTAVATTADTVYLSDRLGNPRSFAVVPTPGATPSAKDHTLQGRGMVGACGSDQGTGLVRSLALAPEPQSSQGVFAVHLQVASGTVETSILQAMGCSDSGGAYGGGGDCKLPRRPAEVAISGLNVGQALTGTRTAFVGTKETNLASKFDQPSDIVAHPTHKLLLVTATGTDNVLVLRFDDNSGLTPMAELTVGKAPSGIALAPDGKTAYVLNAHDYTVGAVPLAGVLAFGNGDPLTIGQAQTVSIGVDPLPEQLRLGRRIFTYARNPGLSKDGQFACATCHLDGAEDGQVWFVAGGPRQTPALAGRLAGSAPFNWGGTHDVLTDNMKETIGRMGGVGLTQVEIDALEAFLLQGLRAPRNPNVAAALTPSQAAGKAIFDDPKVGCGSCHVGGKTNGLSFDVGTMSEADFTVHAKVLGQDVKGVAYDTPSLVGLFATAPYLHDGSAKTLDDVLKLSDAGKMGNTAGLSKQQREDLKAYLLTL